MGHDIGRVIDDYVEAVIELTAYLITSTSEVIGSSDHDQIIWASLKDLNSYDLADADRPILQFLNEAL